MSARTINEKNLAACDDQAPGTTNEAGIVGCMGAQRKEVATLAAHLALTGFSLHELAEGGFLVSRWDRTLHCSDLQQVAAFLRRLGVHTW